MIRLEMKNNNMILTLIWVGRGANFTLLPSWFFLNNSKTVKAVTLKFYSIHNSPQSPDIGKNSEVGISNFRISSLSLIKENCHNSRTSDDIDMKLGPVTKLEKRNKTTSNKFDFDVILESYDVIVIFPIFGQFGAIRRPDSGHRVCKSYIFSNRNLLSYKN